MLQVRLRAGAWIETRPSPPDTLSALVRLRAGAWIETSLRKRIATFWRSSPPRGGVD